MKSFYIAFMLEYASYVNLLEDLFIASVLGYIELKFDQINEHVRKLGSDKKFIIQEAWEHSEIRSCQTCAKSVSNECITWIVIHLHLELRKISRELNTIFGLQMTAKMSTYFAFIALCFSEIFNIMMIRNYDHKGTLYLILVITYLILFIFKLLIINYMCEKVSIKANATGDLINRISYCTYDIVVHENILQLLLQITQAPVKFYGLGLFQFGLKFLHGFCSSVATVIVILVQSHINK
ncbi:PREDICTED: uncharacterized protein LOC106743052 [Dinoponera quadriceps]|uniref:Uncharacterized protein LOC106743052 n=1 Tax=Dinoponera quadriceps TaxID=609295 RepID=A0A6P3X107_DINQU|nr:PREDICTED: uncharacterized protein LOC106743052 [Dinoponera quadriceps]